MGKTYKFDDWYSKQLQDFYEESNEGDFTPADLIYISDRIQHILNFNGINRWLSNFAPCSLEFDGLTYPTTEHAYQLSKIENWYDRKRYYDLFNITKLEAWQIKKISKKFPIREDWEEVKTNYMLDILRIKFNKSLNPVYYSKLITTVNFDVMDKVSQEQINNILNFKMIIEGNTWNDRFWGVCNGIGENHLGKIIMQIRNELLVSLGLNLQIPKWQNWNYGEHK